MVKAKMVLCFLLAAALILPLSFAAAPAVQADSEEPQGEAEAVPIFDGVPDVVGVYQMKGKFTLYDWTCNKLVESRAGLLIIPCQDSANRHKVEVMFDIDGMGGTPTVSLPDINQQMEKQPGNGCPIYGYNGYVGSELVDVKGKVKNTPRLSGMWYIGEYCKYPTTWFQTYTLNAKIKLDKYGHVKSIKGNFLGWMEAGSAFDDNSATVGQFEGKFTATPYTGPLDENGLPPGVSLPDQSP